MAMLSFVFFAFLAILALVACKRSGKLAIQFINNLFDKIEEKMNGH